MFSAIERLAQLTRYPDSIKRQRSWGTLYIYGDINDNFDLVLELPTHTHP